MKKSKVYLKDIMSLHQDKDYNELYAYVMEQIDKGELEPVRRAGTNGRKPALPLAFWHYIEEADYSWVYDELMFKIHPAIDASYYRAHPDRYKKDKEDIECLSEYMKKSAGLLEIQETMNERSFEIFRREKFFQEKGGLSGGRT